jgi:hypothetical protein
LDWPPDVFAFTGSLLAGSGVYRFVICPPPGQSWPPAGSCPEQEPWEAAVHRWAADWLAWLAEPSPGERGADPPEELVRFAATIEDAHDVPLAELEEEPHWDVVVAILALHAVADEASAGAGLRAGTPLLETAALRLAEHGSLSRLGSDRVRVLPKLRPPEAGITLRSLSHHLALDSSEVQTRWYLPRREVPHAGTQTPKLTMLLVPYPATIYASDFRPVGGPLRSMDTSQYGFYEYVPQEPFDPHEVIRLAETARRHVGPVDVVVMPEAALDATVVPELEELLADAGVPYLLAGVREQARPGSVFGANYAHFAGRGWHAEPQQKHHRWCLDAAQVHQYHLGASLEPGRRWWEAMTVHRRSLTFVTLSDWLTICPLVCEDLARPDPVADVIRGVGPTLVVGLLLDGPQLAARWPARYASVLADDPGSSVLTLTALGMAERSHPPGCSPSRVVALWKDSHRGLHEIPLAEGARAVAVTAHIRDVTAWTADGRRRGARVPELVLSGLEQIP